ncbi:hypothetical protein Taro_001254 [Colocasia esculenta]|uniref:Uncharacterized protein n=1 Tax=Colocasia esculenta TaxID=4460 RepID=A0A843TFN8_COLES|nr:hypothetical protein [Colocasia esculenta]
MTFTFTCTPLVGFCTSTGRVNMPQRVPFYDTGGLKHMCLDVHRFMMPEDLSICLDVRRFMTPEGLSTCLDARRFMTPEGLSTCLDVRRSMAPEDLSTCLGGLITTCGVSVWANAGGLDHGEEAPTGVEDLPRLVRPIQAHARTTFEHGQTLGREACVRSSEPFYGPIRIVLGISSNGGMPLAGCLCLRLSNVASTYVV